MDGDSSAVGLLMVRKAVVDAARNCDRTRREERAGPVDQRGARDWHPHPQHRVPSLASPSFRHMDGDGQLDDRIKPTSLLTPSATPPRLRVNQLERKSSAANGSHFSRRAPSASSASTSSLDPDGIDYEGERLASIQRLQERWSKLAERYSRALDEDDIIDLRENKLVKDRGVVRAQLRETRFGHLFPFDNDDNEDDDDDVSEGADAQTEVEESDDEIDAFGNDHHKLGGHRPVPLPLTVSNL